MVTDVMGVELRRVVAGPGQADRVLLALEDAGFICNRRWNQTRVMPL